MARHLGQVSPEGAWLDQMVDRVFTVAAVLLLLVHGAWMDAETTRSGAGLPVLLGLACAREIVALPGVVIARWRKVRLYHVEYVCKIATFVQSATLGLIILDVSLALYPSLACAGVGIVSGTNYLRYSLTADPLA